jgi:hypothetical protein
MIYGERNLEIRDLANQTIEYVEQYYHKHKREGLKPAIWDLILTIRYLTHEVNATEERIKRAEKARGEHRLDCDAYGCNKKAVIITRRYNKIYCAFHAGENEFCPYCGNDLNKHDYCYTCDEYYHSEDYADQDFEVDDYDRDFKHDER